MSDYRLRPPGLDDAGAVAAFQTAAWNDAYAGIVSADYLDRTTVQVRRQRWAQRILAGERLIMLAETGGELVAVASSGSKDGGLELITLYLARAHWGTGLAETLLQAVIGERAAHLWVFEANPRAIAFYRKQGFAPDGTAKIDEDTGLAEVRMTRG
ncbi:GNAT family N-acetyltransferase [Jatrophihabitans sp. GAS493]|uniref:GNAT family N-acetyltransferase n=1 Tax=Jatrophihabitans sp. GAS493 TaxID=1907575 RepID=UPI0012FD373A|nr:GNAT family N-acetyltransferase [Jatrophihabitans sp. GAS493]